MRHLELIDEALNDLHDVRQILGPRMRSGDSLADVVRRLVAEVEAERSPAMHAPAAPVSPLAGLLTARQVVERCPALTLFALKKLMFHSRANGLEAHLIRSGRRVYFDEQGFAEWLRTRTRK